jgi:hypothetical protein
MLEQLEVAATSLKTPILTELKMLPPTLPLVETDCCATSKPDDNTASTTPVSANITIEIRTALLMANIFP